MKNAMDCAIDVFKKRFPFIDHTHGFNGTGLRKLLDVARTRRANHPLSVCEVGSWMGGSARFFAEQPDVESVHCIDHWDRNKVENWYPGRHPEHWMNFMYEQFLANCMHTGLAHKIYPLRMKSHEAAAQIADMKFDLVYLDGAHRTEMVMQDLKDYYPLARLLCGDDWVFVREPENVRGAVEVFAKERGLTVHSDGNLWWYES